MMTVSLCHRRQDLAAPAEAGIASRCEADQNRGDKLGKDEDLLQAAPVTVRFGVVLLAAGEGARMGGVAKCLIRLDGEPLIRRSLRAMHEAGAAAVVVVTGYYADAIEAEVEAADAAAVHTTAHIAAQVVRNPDPARGQGSSVGIGLAALCGDHALGLANDIEAVVIALADQPLVGRAEIAKLLAGFRGRPPGTDVVYPMVRGQRGNPVVLSGALATQLLASGQAGAVRKFIDTHPVRVHQLLTDTDAFITDLDTRDDIAAFEARTSARVALPGPAAA